MNDLYEVLSSIAETEKDLSFKTMTTLRIGGTAAYTVFPANDLELMQVIKYVNENSIPWKMIGKGSDLLCSDRRYDGVVIRLDRHFDDFRFTDDTAFVQAGVSIIALSVHAMKRGLSGLEFASGIPGTIGGAVFMNAGAYKSSISEVITEVLVLHDDKLEWMPKEACEFSYRSSIFQKHPEWIIAAVRLKLEPKDSKEIENLMNDRRERRLKSQPLEYPSCGSVFRNPEGMNAWQLIAEIGYRGMRKGGACVSEKHCNFIVNVDHASADDYLALIEEIQQKVQERYDVRLHTEVEKFNW